MKKTLVSFCLLFISLSSFSQKKPHVVFVFGDEEYRSEESMPMIARILKRELGAKITLCYPLDKDGKVNPNINNNISGLEALKTADMMVLFCRWRELPTNQIKLITDFAESGKPIAGFRTSTHTFKYSKDSSLMKYNDKWPTDVLGQQWITHHGHFEDGSKPLTSVYHIQNVKSNILNGVKPFDAYSWLYHVDGGDWKLNPTCTPILEGKSLRSKIEADGKLDKYPKIQPVAWTKPYVTVSGKTARVFFTTLGHPFDFKDESMRKLALNGIYWALGLENKIPKDGVNVNIDGTYEPNNSGFGEKYKKDLLPVQIK